MKNDSSKDSKTTNRPTINYFIGRLNFPHEFQHRSNQINSENEFHFQEENPHSVFLEKKRENISENNFFLGKLKGLQLEFGMKYLETEKWLNIFK
jgi:hypothetical protein